MIKITFPKMRYSLIGCMLALLSFSGFAQVGINTNAPQGILDVASTTQGVVLPRVGLTSTTVAAPVVNPQSGVIPIGTAVYNKNKSGDVSKGIYVWDGNKWNAQFSRHQAERFTQNTLVLRTIVNTDKAIALSSANFTAKYTGTYKIDLNVNFGAGTAKTPGNNDLNVAVQEGNFTFTFKGNDYTIPANSISTSYPSNRGGTYYGIWKQIQHIIYVNLTADEVANFSLKFRMNASPEFNDDGTANDGDGNASSGGNGYVGLDLPCTLEIIYMGDQ